MLIMRGLTLIEAASSSSSISEPAADGAGSEREGQKTCLDIALLWCKADCQTHSLRICTPASSLPSWSLLAGET